MNIRKSFSMVVILLVVTILLLNVGSIGAATSLLDDAFFPGTGGATFLNAQSDGADNCATKTSTAVWKFDTSGIGTETVASAELTIRVTSAGSLNGNTRLNLVQISDTAWTDSDISSLTSSDVGSVIEFIDIPNGSQPGAGTNLTFNSGALASYFDSAGSSAAVGIQVANCDGGGTPAIQFTSQEGGTAATLVLRNPTNVNLTSLNATVTSSMNELAIVLAVVLPLIAAVFVIVLRRRNSFS